MEELNWKVVDQFQRVWEPKSHNPNLYSSVEAPKPEEQEEKLEKPESDKDDSTGETACKSGDEIGEKGNAQR